MEQLFYVTSIRFVENLLAREIETCGGKVERSVPGGLLFRATLEQAYRFCYTTRLASRLGLVLGEAPCHNREELYDMALTQEWKDHILPLQKIKFRAAIYKAEWTNASFACMVAKDGVADYFREKTGQRPIIETRNPEAVLFVMIYKNSGWIGIDLHIDSLSHRGYRLDKTEAPLRENTAAAVLMRAHWPEDFQPNACFLDPMCGSGTLAIEAALMAAGKAPGLFNDDLFSAKWKGHDRKLIEATIEWAKSLEKEPATQRTYYAVDIDPNALSAARANAKRAGVNDRIKFILADSVNGGLLSITTSQSGLVAVNPPYGKRIFRGTPLPDLYAKLGKALSDSMGGWRLAVITEDGPLSRAMRLRPYKSGRLSNGSIDCTLSLFLLHGKDAKKSGMAVDEITDDDNWEELPGSKPEEKDRHFDERAALPEDALAEDLFNRLKKNIKLTSRAAKRENVECYRFYDKDLPEYAFAADIYAERNIVIQEYRAPKTIDPDKAASRYALAVRTVRKLFPDAKIHEKIREKQRGSDQYTKQAASGKFFVVNENGLKLYVNFTDYLYTGLFLDHRPLRAIVKANSEGKKVLNLFSYTGSISVAAAAGGAIETLSIDSSKTYTQWAERNFEINSLDLKTNKLLRADALEYLDENTDRFDIIILDPPTFSNSKDRETILDIQRDHSDLVTKCMKKIKPNGTLYFSTNARKFKLDDHLMEDFIVTDITSKTIGFDFDRNRKIHVCFEIKLRF